MTVGVLAAFLLYLRMFFEPMQEITQFFNTFQSASSALEKLAGVLAEQPGIADPQRPVALRAVRGDIAFADVRSSMSRTGRCCRVLNCLVPGGADRRAGRHHRGGQDHDRQADCALLRPDGRLGDAGWH